MSGQDLAGWSGRPAPEPVVLEGRYMRLDPLRPKHAAGLFAAAKGRPELVKGRNRDTTWFAILDRQ